MKERPILVAIIGYIIGILWGLYFKISIVPFYILIFATYYIYIKIFKINKKNKFKLVSFSRYSKYLKLIINSKVILIIVIFSIISNMVIYYYNNKYENIYKDEESIKFTGIVISQKIESKFYNSYKVKLLYSNFNIYIQIGKNENELEYGDKIYIEGEYRKPSKQRNYGGYDDSKYLKTLKIIGRVKVKQIELLSKRQLNFIFQVANDINLKLKENIDNTFEKEKAKILKGLLLGSKEDLDEDIKENFQILNISHILAISGMHIGYIIIGIQLLLKKIIGKRLTNLLISIILICYIFITGFSASIIRATVMSILVIYAHVFNRKNDIWNSIALSLFGILIYNPFLLLDIGLQLSYLGTIGIILFNSTISQMLENLKLKTESKIIKNIKDILSVTISAQIMIFPILTINFHIVSIYSLISNLFVSIIIGPIIIFSFICVIISFIYSPIIKLFIPLLYCGFEILNFISKLSILPFSKIYIPKPNMYIIIVYFINIFVIKYIYKIYTLLKLNETHRRVKNLIALAKYRFNQNKGKYIKYLIMGFAILIIFKAIPENLKIYFIDVGQGDSTFIVTPYNKTILIDGGGSINDDFDVGKKTLLPYILNRGYTCLDYVIISHFDQDHVRTEFYMY